jgi:ABC-type transporter Mla subunit MlaD
VENLLDKSVPSLLKATEQLVSVHSDVSTLLTSLDGTVTELNQKLPELLENINGITASMQQMSESEIRQTTHNIQEITDTVNQNIAKIDELVNTVTDFSQTTVKHVEYYRDQLSVPVSDFVSAWSAVKTGWETFNRSRKSGGSDSEDSSEEEQDG